MAKSRYLSSASIDNHEPIGLAVAYLPPREAKFSRVVTFYMISSPSKPWAHCAVGMEGYCVSVYPSTHNSNRVTTDDDPLDPAAKVRGLFSRAIGPAIYSRICFKKIKETELAPYKPVQVVVPVTEEQYARAETYIQQLQQGSESSRIHYSLFGPLGKSCAEVGRGVLSVIVANSPDSRTADSGLDRLMALPCRVQRKAEQVAAQRQQRRVWVSNQALVASPSVRTLLPHLTRNVVAFFTPPLPTNDDKYLSTLCRMGSIA